MQLDSVAVNVIAQFISRGEHLTLNANADDSQGVVVCDRCNSPTAITVPVRGISDKAVYQLGTVTVCAGCDATGEIQERTSPNYQAPI